MGKHRLKQLAETLGISVNQLEKEVGVGVSTFNKSIQRNSEINRGIVLMIRERYPNISEEWIENGTEPMFIDLTPELNDPSTKYTKKPQKITLLGKHAPLRLSAEEYGEAFGDWEGLPMYNTPVTASFVETYRDETLYQPQYYMHDPRFRDCDFGAIITGDSMHSEIRHGDFIACKEVTDKRFIVYGDIYYIVATNGLETCKYVNADPSDKDNFMLIAKNEKISPSPLPKDMILKLYKVRGIIRGY